MNTAASKTWVWILGLLAIWGVDLFFAQEIDPYFFTILMYAGINVMLAVSLNLVNGFTGQFSIGHAGFMAVGGYASAYLSLAIFALGYSFLPLKASSHLDIGK